MATVVHTLSSSEEENSNDSLPDLAAERKKTVTVTQKPETFTLSSDEEENQSGNNRESIDSEEMQKGLPDVCDFPDPPSFHITEEEPEMIQEEEQPLTRPLKKLRTEELRTEKEAKRMQREKEKQRIAAEKAETKAKREAERASKRAMKPGECMKFIVVEVDRGLVECGAGSQVVGRLSQDGGGARVRVVDAPVPASVTFLRVNPLTLQESQAEEGVVVLEVEEFVSGVEQQVYGQMESGRGLCHMCRAWQKKLAAPKLTLVVCGIDQYFKEDKRRKQQAVRSTVVGGSTRSNNNNNNKKQHSTSQPPVTRVDIETALVMGQLECGLNHRLLSDPEKVATYILQVTKAVAEAPFKRERSEAVFSWYAEGSSSSCVRVDKTGVGLLKLWHQQLRQFNNVGVEVAQAVAREYCGPKALMQAYERCSTRQEASLLLADIPVRRGASVLASTRRIGPELSRKIHLFLTATDPDINLGQKT